MEKSLLQQFNQRLEQLIAQYKKTRSENLVLKEQLFELSQDYKNMKKRNQQAHDKLSKLLEQIELQSTHHES